MLTTCEITIAQRWSGVSALILPGAYCLRWRIEDWHGVLKIDCSIEALQHKTAEQPKRAIAIHLVLAWRIVLMTLLGRASPDVPAERLFSNLEIEVRQAYAKQDESTSRLGGTIGRAKYANPSEPDHLAGLFETAVPLQRPVSAQWDIGPNQTIWVKGNATRSRPWPILRV